MAMPAAREGHLNNCNVPFMQPHGIGPISGLVGSGVLICNGLAATVTSLCTCNSPQIPTLNAIATGASTVLIKGLPVARVLDKTTHLGFITSGEGTVLIGNYAVGAAAKIFPGRQRFGNCGVLCCQQIIHQVWGLKYYDKWMLDEMIKANYAFDNSNPRKRGGTTYKTMQAMLGFFDIQSDIYYNPSTDELSQLLREDAGIIALVDPGTLWKDSNFIGDSHAIFITEGDFDEHGQLTQVYINDTGSGAQGRRVSIARLKKAQNAHDTGLGPARFEFIATTEPIWKGLPPFPAIPPATLPALFVDANIA